jgi:hypothetical protein
MEAMSVDADTSGNTATALGTQTACIAATAGTSVEIDITALNIPPYNNGGTPGDPTDDTGGIGSYSYVLQYDEVNLTVQAQNQGFLVASNAGSSLFNASDTVPDTDGSNAFAGAVLDTGTGVPEGGSGVLERITIAIEAAAPAGLYTLVLDPNNSAHLDASGAAYPPLAINDATIAVGVTCP